MIKTKIEEDGYPDAKSLHKDMMLLFENARDFDQTNVPDERYVTEDADALQEVMLHMMEKECGMRRAGGAASTAAANKISKKEAEALAAIKTIPVPPREKLAGAFAEKMHTVYDLMQVVICIQNDEFCIKNDELCV